MWANFSTMITTNHIYINCLRINEKLTQIVDINDWLLKFIETWVNIVRLWHIFRNLTRANFHDSFRRSTAAKRYFSIGIVLWFHMAFAKNNVAFGVAACSEFIATDETFEERERVGRGMANAKIGKFVSAPPTPDCFAHTEREQVNDQGSERESPDRPDGCLISILINSQV